MIDELIKYSLLSRRIWTNRFSINILDKISMYILGNILFCCKFFC